MKEAEGARRAGMGLISQNIEHRLASSIRAGVSAVRGFVSGALNLRDLRAEHQRGAERRFKESSRCC
jgi:hypothetical protein